MNTKTREKSGFTLVELLVVIAIIAMLVTLLLPAVQAAREAARRSQCQNNLKQIGLALINHESAHEVYPLGVYSSANVAEDGYGWATKLLPFMEETAVYDRISQNYIPGEEQTSPWDRPGIFGATRSRTQSIVPGGDTSIATFLCPSSPLLPHVPQGGANAGYAKSDYKGCNGWADFGIFWNVRDGEAIARTKISQKDVLDGTSKTIAFGESSYVPALNDYPVWMGAVERDESTLFKTQLPSVINCGARAKVNDASVMRPVDDDCAFGWHSGGGVLFSFADGSVHSLSETIEWQTYQNLGDRRDGQPLGQFE